MLRPKLDPTRANRITASMAPYILCGDTIRLQNFFLRLIGDDRYVEDDFSTTWLAHYGLAVEPLALDWHEKKTSHALTRRQEQVFHPTRSFVSATLDAWRAFDNTVLDVKCVNSYRSIDDTVNFYAPQVVVQMDCAGADHCALLIVHGGAEPIECPIFINQDYSAAVWNAIDRFWHCVETFTPPVELQFKRIVPPEQWRSVDLDKDADLPNWADEMAGLLFGWDITEATAQHHEMLKSEIKKLLPDDVGRVASGQIMISRTRSNAVTIRRRKA